MQFYILGVTTHAHQAKVLEVPPKRKFYDSTVIYENLARFYRFGEECIS